jgi:hypothetical protein
MRLITGYAILLLFVTPVLAQHSFEISYATEEDETIISGAIDNQGNVILVGNIGTFNGFHYDGLVMKILPDGNYFTQRFNIEGAFSYFSEVVILDDGNYFIIGSLRFDSVYTNNKYLWVLTLDGSLEIIHEETYLINEDYVGYGPYMKALIGNDSIIRLVGQAYELNTNPNQTQTDYVMFKLSQNGDTLLSKYYPFPHWETPYDLIKIPGSDELMLIGQAISLYGTPELVFLDGDMNILYYNKIIQGMKGRLNTDLWLNDTDFLMAGNNNSNNERYIGVYHMDTSAYMHYELVLDRPDTVDYMASFKSMAYANDSTIYIVGYQSYIQLWTTVPTKVFLYVIDRDMNLLGMKYLGGDANYSTSGIINAHDDGCLIWGRRYVNPDGIPERDIHIWKVLREEIEISVSVEHINKPGYKASVWPNPVSEELFVSISGINVDAESRFQIYNMAGYKLYDSRISSEGNFLKVNVRNLEAGVYAYRIIQGRHEAISGKFIKIN